MCLYGIPNMCYVLFFYFSVLTYLEWSDWPMRNTSCCSLLRRVVIPGHRGLCGMFYQCTANFQEGLNFSQYNISIYDYKSRCFLYCTVISPIIDTSEAHTQSGTIMNIDLWNSFHREHRTQCGTSMNIALWNSFHGEHRTQTVTSMNIDLRNSFRREYRTQTANGWILMFGERTTSGECRTRRRWKGLHRILHWLINLLNCSLIDNDRSCSTALQC